MQFPLFAKTCNFNLFCFTFRCVTFRYITWLYHFHKVRSTTATHSKRKTEEKEKSAEWQITEAATYQSSVSIKIWQLNDLQTMWVSECFYL